MSENVNVPAHVLAIARQAEEIINRKLGNKPRWYDRAIRREAKKQKLTATKSRRDGKWYIANENNYLLTYNNGLDDAEALTWLQQNQ